jgi:hypothetical protein
MHTGFFMKLATDSFTKTVYPSQFRRTRSCKNLQAFLGAPRERNWFTSCQRQDQKIFGTEVVEE